MHPPGTFARGRFVAAIVVSLSLHAMVGLAWLHSQPNGSAGRDGLDVRVESPGDNETSFTLLETKSEFKPPVAKKPTVPPKTEPSKLPGAILEGPATGLAKVTLIGPSQDVPGSLPKIGGPASLHGKLKPGTTVVYVLDCSASMGPEDLLGRAIASLKASLAEVGTDARFQIVAYNGGTASFAREPVPATPGYVKLALVWLKELTAEGRSDHRAGFREALAYHPDVMFLLTDADDLEESDVRVIRAMMRNPVNLHAVVFGNQRPTVDSPLERLTRSAGGTVEYVAPNNQ